MGRNLAAERRGPRQAGAGPYRGCATPLRRPSHRTLPQLPDLFPPRINGANQQPKRQHLMNLAQTLGKGPGVKEKEYDEVALAGKG